MGSHQSIKEFAARANKLDRLDVLLENAGVANSKFTTIGDEESTIAVNVTGTFLLALELLPKLRDSARKHGTGHLTIVSSTVHSFTQLPESEAEEGIFKTLNNPVSHLFI